MRRKKSVTFKLEPRMIDLIKEYSEENEITYTKIIENALIEYFQKRNKNVFL